MNSKSNNIFRITLTAVLSAFSFALMFIEFPVPVMPPFIKFDISDLPALFGAVTLGPIYGVIIQLIKNLLHILLKGSSSMFVGEASNFLLGSVFCLVTSLIFKSKKFKTILIPSIIGSVIMGIISVPVNYYIIYPAYVKFYNLPLDSIIEMYKAILNSVSEIPTKNVLLNCLLIFNLPFTAIKGIIDAILCAVAYKPLKKTINKNN